MYFLILVSYSCNFDKPVSLKVIVKCLVLHSGGIRFPPKERGFFLTGSRHVSLSCSCYTHTSCIMSDVTINKLGLLLAGSRAICPNLVQQPVSYLPVKSCCLLSDSGYRVNSVSLSTTATFFCPGGQPIHYLLFKTLYNGHLSTTATATKARSQLAK